MSINNLFRHKIADTVRGLITPPGTHDPDGDPDGWVSTPKELVNSAPLVGLVKQCGDVLEREYPGWMWCIEPDERGGIINVSSMRFPPVNNKRPGFTLKIASIQNDPQVNRLRVFAGELLERFGCRRGAYDSDNWRAVNAAAVRRYGAFLPDISDKASATRKSMRADAIRDGINSGRARVLTEGELRAMRHAAA